MRREREKERKRERIIRRVDKIGPGVVGVVSGESE